MEGEAGDKYKTVCILYRDVSRKKLVACGWIGEKGWILYMTHCHDFHPRFSQNEENLSKNILEQYCYSNGSAPCMYVAVYRFIKEQLHLHLLTLTVSHISIPVQILGNNRLKFFPTKIRGFATELRTNLLLYTAATYLYAHSDVPSKRCFALTCWCCACLGWSGQQAPWSVSPGCACRPEGCSPSCSSWGRRCWCFLTLMPWLPDGAHTLSPEKLMVHMEVAPLHLPTPWAKKSPVRSKCESFDSSFLTALYSFTQSFLFLSTPIQF